MKKYIATEIEKMYEICYQTVNKRMKSKYAQKRWGVEIEDLPDGSIRRYIPEDKLPLWESKVSYKGRPVFRKVE